jgi:hypothetical protein
MRPIDPACLVLALFLAGSAGAETVRPGFFSVRVPVVAILHDELFVGEAVGYVDRTGTIEVKSVVDSADRCVGTFRYTGSDTGVVQLRCHDGSEARLSFEGLGAFSGYGQGNTRRGPASFTFGLDPAEAASHLKVPPDKKLVEGAEGLRLESIRP